MNREDLIDAIFNSTETWACPEYICDMPEEEGNTGECCLKCAEKLLAGYDAKIRADAIEEYRKEMRDIIEGDEEFTDWQKYEFLECNEVVAELLKERKHE